MKKLTSFGLVFFSLFSFSQFDPIKNFQKKIIADEKTGSNVVMVFQNNRVIFENIENSNKEGDKKINKETIFPIFSMTKPITIVALMTLYEKGLINFNDNLSKYIPEFKNLKCKNSEGVVYKCKNQLKLIHLMTHRSGYGYYNNPYHFTSTIKYNNLIDFVTDVSSHPVEFEPGTDFLYGINQAILGRVVEVVTKKSFYQYLKETIFDPLDMNETKFYLTVEDRDRFQPLYINSQSLKGFTNFLDEMTYDINNKAYFGGEGLVSTMSDYSKFCIMLLNKGVYNKKKIISESSIKMMTRKYSNVNENDEFLELNNGFYHGFSLFVLNDPIIDGTNSSKGIYGWSGYHNTHFWIDPKKNLFGLFMTRAREFDFNIQKSFRKAVYASVR